MAEHLARIIGTEEDRVNCPFYWKIGACRHGDQCSRSHYKPTVSQTLVLRHMYRNPPIALAIAEGQDVDDELADQAQDHFEGFYTEVFEELAKYGQVEELVACDNIGDHMIGNVYVKYASEDDAIQACKNLQGRFYEGRRIECEFSPVTDFREARCRQFVEGCCTRGGYCNFMHMKHVPRSLKRKMVKQMFKDHPDYKETAGMMADDPSRGRGRERGTGGPPSNNRRRSYSPQGRRGDYRRRSFSPRRQQHHRMDYRPPRYDSRERGSSGYDRRPSDRRSDHRNSRGDRGGEESSRRDDHLSSRGSRDDRRNGRRDERTSHDRGGDMGRGGGTSRRSRDDNRGSHGGYVRKSSEERRAEIARWNDEMGS